MVRKRAPRRRRGHSMSSPFLSSTNSRATDLECMSSSSAPTRSLSRSLRCSTLFGAAATTALALVLTALIYFGVAQAIDYLGRTAHSTNRLCNLIETSVVRHIQSIETRISSSTPIRVRIDQPQEDKARYHYTADGPQEGPFTAAEMRDFRESGVISTATQVFREGDSDWRTFKDYTDLARP